MTKYDPKDDPSSWQHDKSAHPGGPHAGVPGGPIPIRGPMTLEQHQWLHPRTAHADFAAQEAQSDRRSRREAVSGGAPGRANDADHAWAEWHKSFDALRAAGLEGHADHPIAAHYRDASDAVIRA